MSLPRPASPPGRRLGDLADRLGAAVPVTADPGTLVAGITLDSRAVRPGDVYAALPGQRSHGAQFADEAARRGAVAVVTDAAGAALAADAGVPVISVPDPRGVLGATAAWVYGEPAERLLLLGVTGTNGKTTTTFLLEAALREAGHTTGLVGTIETRIADERVASVRTTPEAPDLHALLALMAERGVTACAVEVSSHALALHRVDGVVFDVVGFTNLSQDHLDFHADLEDYFAAKAALFTPERARRGVVCVDDSWGRRLAAQAQVPVVTVATADSVRSGAASQPEPDWRVVDRLVDASGATSFTLRSSGSQALRVTCPLPGDFNVANTALAVVMLVEAGVEPHVAAHGLSSSDGVPGRMERVGTGAPGLPLAVVDYAHTADAIEAAATALRPATAGRLLVVLGAGGDRDRGKRHAMGAAAARYADVVVVTDDNPRSEDPAQIRAAVLEGARHEAESTGADVRDVGDRRAAIRTAVELARAGDTVLVAGKGHEQGQEIAGTVHPFDDRQVLGEALAARAAQAEEPG